MLNSIDLWKPSLLKGATENLFHLCETDDSFLVWMLFQSLLTAVTNKNIDFWVAWLLSNLKDPYWISVQNNTYALISLSALEHLKPTLLCKMSYCKQLWGIVGYVHCPNEWTLNSVVRDAQYGLHFTLVDSVAMEALSTARWTVVMSTLRVSINIESLQCDHDKTCMIL